MNIFQKSQKYYFDKMPFVMYCKPNSREVFALFQKDDLLYEIEDFQESGFAFVSFDGSKKYYFPLEKAEISQENHQFNEIIGEKYIFSETKTSKNQFENLVENGVEAIKKNQFEKVVLSRKEDFEIEDFDFITTFKNSLKLYPTAFKYVLFHPQLGLWFGASPEQFIKLENKILKTVALAGTQLDSEHNLWKEKEIDEQKIVSDFIKNTFLNLSETIRISEPYTVKAGNLLHLKTDIEAHLKEDLKIKDIIEKLHPTPAVCGFPKEISKEFIVKNEGYDRSFYTGFLGEMNMLDRKKDSFLDLYVNLRCMQYEEQLVSIYVGCGITLESNPEKEYLETVNKSKTIKNTIYGYN